MNLKVNRYCIIFFMILFLCPLSLLAKEIKHVKVAAFNLDTFFSFDENHNPVSGYALEYINTIANYAGWEVEFIQEKSFAEGLNKIINCEADIIFEVTKSLEREPLMLFPSLPMGKENFILYARSGNKSISLSDIQTFSGKKIGIPQNDYEINLIKNWCEKNNIRAEIIPFHSTKEKEQALISGKIDLLCEVGMNLSSEISPIMVIQTSDYYLVANKKRPDLLLDINEAQRKLQNNDPFYISRLSEKYFYESSGAKALSQDEREWLSKHDTLKIGFFPYFFPFTFYDKKKEKVSGFPLDLVNLLLSKVGLQTLKVEYFPSLSYDQLYNDLINKKIDVILPYYNNSRQVRQKAGMITSRDIYLTTMGLLYEPELNFQDALKKIGVLESGIAFYFMKDHFPQSELIIYDSPENLVDALKNGTVSGMVASLYALTNFFKGDIGSLQLRPLYNECNIAFAASKDNINLISILNRARSLTKNSEIISREQRYNVSNKQTIISFLRSHFLGIFCIFFTVLIVISTVLILLYRINKKLVFASSVVRQQKEKLQNQQDMLYKALQEANKANEAKSSFLFNMSHDLRTPMNAVMGFCNMAALHIGNMNYVKNCLEKLRSAGEFLLLLINDILDMSKIGSVKFELSESITDIIQLVKTIEPMFQYSADNKKIRLSFSISNVKNRYVYLDEKHLSKVLANLIENAVSYNKEGGWVKVELRQTEELRENNPVYSFTIEDNGIGMSEDFQKIMYDSFSREQNSTQAGIQGTGLGLSFCRQVVKLMNGTILCKSNKGEGTLFTLKIPFKISEKDNDMLPHTESIQISPCSLKGKRCLIVEDNKLNQEILKDMLEEEGVMTDTADNGEIAVHKLQQFDPEYYDFILMDIQMPVMNGYEAAETIRSMPAFRKIPIIAVSANTFEEDKQKSLRSGMNDHIAKPVDAELLIKILAQYL